MHKSLEGILVTSQYIQRRQILFDQSSGRILNIGENLVDKENIDYFFNDDHLIFAGMGDVHIHAREDVSGQHTYKETFESASHAALNGGVVHVCDMPNNPIAPIDDQTYMAKHELAAKAPINICLYAGVGPGTEPLAQRVPYKVYMGPSVGELFFNSLDEIEEVLQHYRGCDVSFHCEDPETLEKNKDLETHFSRRPASAELLATKKAIELIEKFKLRGKLCHYSVGTGLDCINEARRRRVDIEVEVTPQHLYFCEEGLKQEVFLRMQMNPPIRIESEREKMLLALKNGEIDYLATDHAPHTIDEKEKGTSGLTGLDTYGGFVTWLISNQKIDPKIIAKICCENPGKFVHRFSKIQSYAAESKGFGFLEKDYEASFTVLNMNNPYTVTTDSLKTLVAWSPFEGETFPGRVAKVFLKGRVI